MITLRSALVHSIVLSCALLLARKAYPEGTVANCTEADLRAALSEGGTVAFACSGTIVISNTLNIATNTLIDADGNRVIISGGNAVRLFIVNSNVSLELRGISLVDGSVVGARGLDAPYPAPAGPGGDALGAGILNQGGTVRLTSCMLLNNVVLGGVAGNNPGGYHGGYGEAAGGAAFGAAICNLGGTIFLTNCVLATNRALGGLGSLAYYSIGGGGPGGPASGGAIYSENGGALFVQDSTVLNNTAAGGLVRGQGGNALGGGLVLHLSSLSLLNSRLLNNRALGGADPNFQDSPNVSAGDAHGGALFIGPDAAATVRGCALGGNAAIGGDGTMYSAGGLGLGGAVYAEGPLDSWDSSFCSNGVVTGIGVAYGVVGPGGLYWPGLPGRGGAIWSSNSLTLNGCTFWTNTAFGGRCGSYHTREPGGPAEGGAIWSSGALGVTNSTLVGNFAAGGQGTWALPTEGGGGGFGGALCLTGGVATLMNVTLASNQVTGVQVPPGYILPPGFYLPALGSGLYSTNASVTLLNSIIANNTNGGCVWGKVIDGGYDLCSDDTARLSSAGSQNNIDPRLGPLTANGGPTATMVLLSGSPGRDVIPSGFPPVDQRGVLRPQGAFADIGAVEGDPLDALPPQVSCSSPFVTPFTLYLMAEPFRSYRLLLSTNLQTWEAVATNGLAFAGPLQFYPPTPSAARLFFRMVTP